MGTLIAWHYPTPVFAKLADHTYVTCGNGRARWKCWGGDSGGKALRQGIGSTKRADAIAEPDEKAGITCYLINGVCHQAANRILSPSRITVKGARGYVVSEALFGTYGRPRGVLGMCKAPFHRHQQVNGDLPECETGDNNFSADELESLQKAASPSEESTDEQTYLSRIIGLYESADIESLAEKAEESKGFQTRLFEELVSFRLESSFLDTAGGRELVALRENFEDQRIKVENSLQSEALTTTDFVSEFNALTEKFQIDSANAIDAKDYSRLFELKPGDTVVLGDPEIAESAF